MQTLTPTPSYPIWYVRSSDPNKFYLVSVSPDTRLYTCECPDHTYRQRDCKHIRQVQAGAVRAARLVKGAAAVAGVRTAPTFEPKSMTDAELDAALDDLYGPAKVARR